MDAAREKATFLFDLLHSYLQTRGELVQRLTADFARDPIWNAGLSAALDNDIDALPYLFPDGIGNINDVAVTADGKTVVNGKLVPVMKNNTRVSSSGPAPTAAGSKPLPRSRTNTETRSASASA